MTGDSEADTKRYGLLDDDQPHGGLPPIALSVRQPWAWAIIHAGKSVENRAWSGTNPSLAFRGRVAIHAATGLLRQDYQFARDAMVGVACPPPHELARGGIIGSVEVVDVVTSRDQLTDGEQWWSGPVGLVLRDPRPHPFVPAVGQLGYFRWTRAADDFPPKPAKWMLAGVSTGALSL